jgi:nucleoside-diphosphate-sugar epimerase
MGARGFLGHQIDISLREQGIDVVGITRELGDGDPKSWIKLSSFATRLTTRSEI